MNVIKHNSAAWDKQANSGECEWSVPVSSEVIDRAREGEFSIVLTPLKAVPRDWFPADLNGMDILCLASGGGQQAPVLAAAGANVTCFDNSAAQLEKDRFVADRDGLDIRLEKGDSADLSRFPDASFDFIFNPASNVFFPDLRPVWKEAYRVLRPGGTMLVGFMYPVIFLFDLVKSENGILEVKNPLPYSDLTSLTEEELGKRIAANEPLEFSHTFELQLGGQTGAGFMITGFYEDYWSDEATPLNKYMPTSAATRAVKPR
jgi:SAM-dependent methyltransferase